MSAPGSPRKAGCSVCGKPVDPAYRPFCCKRCADVDLQRWLSGAYVAPGEPIDTEDGNQTSRDETD